MAFCAWLASGCASRKTRPTSPVVESAHPSATETQQAAANDPDLVRIALGKQTALVLVDVEGAASLISTRDAFLRDLTPIDRQVRTGLTTVVDEAAYLAHARAQVRAFEPAQIEKIKTVAAKVGPLLTALDLERWLPREILLVQTTGAEEGFPASFDLSYTRSGVIYVNTRGLQVLSRYLLLHELFHVLTTQQPQLRDALYAAIGFTRVERPRLPETFEPLRLTLPEVPQALHYAIKVQHEGQDVRAVPVCVANEPYTGGSMVDVASSRWAVLDERGTVRSLVDISELSGLMEQVGSNTTALSGPEEMLAENFVLLVLGDPVRTPEIITRMRAILDARH